MPKPNASISPLAARLRAASRGGALGPPGTDSIDELWAAADRAAAALAGCGLEPLLVGCAVADERAFAATWLACSMAGACFVPLPPRATAHEVAAATRLVDCHLLVTDAEPAAESHVSFAALSNGATLQPSQARLDLPSDVRMVQLTSGSTGAPEAILLTETQLAANLRQSRAHLQQRTGKRVFRALPMFHAMGNAVLLELLATGSAQTGSAAFDPARDVAQMGEHGCQALVCTASYLRLLLQLGILDAGHLPRLEDFELGAEPVDPRLVAELRERFPEARIHVRYGLSEGAGALTRLTLPAHATLPCRGAVGTALPGVEVRVVDGELWSRAASCAAERLTVAGRAPLLDGEGYLHTGDDAELAADGTVVLHGRRSAFLKVLGHRVDPLEIEVLLRTLSGIHDAVVIGVDDPLRGQRVHARVELRPGSPVDTDGWAAACRAGLSDFKVPARFEVGTLPRTPSGKVDRAAASALARRTDPDTGES
ncbi:MAG: acyl--CoA ligase [Planctomycetes bacterium]|nr:acyl--CoA ligase [Planctomycetota bacterium]